MSIPKAYCVEVAKVVDIFEAHTIYFSKKKNERKRLDFRCPDERCREEYNPEVLGINYDKDPDKDEFVQRPHFRLKKGDTHSSECPWVEISTAIEELDKEDDGKPYLSHLKKSEIISVFKPLSSDTDSDNYSFNIDAGFLENLRNFSSRRERINELKGYLRNSLCSTSRLHEVVRCYLSMMPDERKIVSLLINPYGSKSYRNWFRSSRYCRYESTPLIYYGAATILSHPDVYAFRFWNESEQIDGARCKIFAHIDRQKFTNFRGRHIFEETLDAGRYQQKKHQYPIDVYAFGEAQRTPQGDRIGIEINSPHSLVIMLSDRGA